MPEPRSAWLPDVIHLRELREEAVAWMLEHRIEQWEPDEVPVQEFSEQVARGEWHVIDDPDGSALVAAVRVLESDEQLWGPQPSDSLYVHGLVVRRSRSGAGLGRELLRWVEDRASRYGKAAVRLDCVETNAALVAYYRGAGYRRLGRCEGLGPWRSATLFEKRW